MARDTDVDLVSDALSGKKILLGVTGGIAATESIRILRELRRHDAELSVIMTKSATRVITPLAVEWAAQASVSTDWSAEMSQLAPSDGLLVCPATRNFMAKFVNGMMDNPLLMACSSARARGTPIVIVPSMHNDLFDDPVTEELCQRAEELGAIILWGPNDEGRRKQPMPVQIVADLSHVVNRNDSSLNIAITLGANRAPIDAVRAIQNASSGSTGWSIAEYLHRKGHTVTCIAGKTSASPSFQLPNIVRAGAPDDMLAACKLVADDFQHGWIFSAAVLDYYTEPEQGKKLSGQESWKLDLKPGPKHILELEKMTKGAVRIGFKLESGVSVELLHKRAQEQIDRYGVDATIANILEEIHDDESPRGYIVTSSGIESIENQLQLCQLIEARIISCLK